MSHRFASPGRMPGLGILFAGCLLASFTACERNAPSASSGTPSATRATQAAVRPPANGYAAQLEKMDAGITRGLELAARTPDDGLIGPEVVSLLLERAQLSGDYEDYARASTLIERLAAQGKPAGALCLVRARLNFSLHRLGAAQAALDQCPATVEAGAIAAQRAHIDQQAGRYRQAEQVFRTLLNQDPLASHYAQLALLRARTGAPAESMALLEAAEKRYHGGSPVMLAWLRLQRGLVALDRGRLDEALALYLLADEALPGWWLIEEHRAEVLHLMGRSAEARALYEKVTAGHPAPEFLDALAAIEREAGNTTRAGELRQRARGRHESRIRQFPEAASGHALDHFIESPDERVRALEMARQNHRLRPGGEATISLARALLANGQPAQAIPLLQAQLAAGWDTAEMHWVLSLALRGAGQGARAEAEARAALARNPLSEKMYGAASP